MRFAISAVAVLASISPALAQDMLGLTWSGQAYLLDTYNGTVTSLGATGRTSINAMAADARGRMWASDRPSTGVYALGTVDPTTGAVTPVFNNTTLDFRGLAGGETDFLWGVVDGGDDLYTIDTTTGAATLIGATGFNGIQGLVNVGNDLLAWDIRQGLVRLDRNTGLGTRISPPNGGTGDIQFLAVRGDGHLIGGGQSELYDIDMVTGAYTLIGSFSPIGLRGAENLRSSIVSFGSGCAATSGPAQLTVTGNPQPGQAVTSTSINHASASLGFVIIGFSTVAYGPTQLPFSVDPLLGTTGCAALCSPDTTEFGITTAQGELTKTLAIPPGLDGLQFYLQHAVFEGGAIRWSWTNGVAVQIAY